MLQAAREASEDASLPLPQLVYKTCVDSNRSQKVYEDLLVGNGLDPKQLDHAHCTAYHALKYAVEYAIRHAITTVQHLSNLKFEYKSAFHGTSHW